MSTNVIKIINDFKVTLIGHVDLELVVHPTLHTSLESEFIIVITFTLSEAPRTPNAISLDASEKERLLELRYTLILLSAHTNSEWVCHYVFHDRVTLFFADNFSTECRITMEFMHNFFRPFRLLQGLKKNCVKIFMVIRRCARKLLAKNSVTRPWNT